MKYLAQLALILCFTATLVWTTVTAYQLKYWVTINLPIFQTMAYDLQIRWPHIEQKIRKLEEQRRGMNQNYWPQGEKKIDEQEASQ